MDHPLLKTAAAGLLCLLILGCQSQLECTDPLGCAIFPAGDPIKIGIVAPISDQRRCPPVAEIIDTLQTVVDRSDPIAGHSIELVVEDSLSNPASAHEQITLLVQDPAIVAVFYLTCSPKPDLAVRTAPAAGIPVFTDHNPAVQTDLGRIFAWLPPVEDHARMISDMLAKLSEEKIFVISDNFERSAMLGEAICVMKADESSACQVHTLESIPAGLPILAEAEAAALADIWLILSPPSPDLTQILHNQLVGHNVILFDPFFAHLPDSSLSPGIYWISPAGWIDPNDSQTEQLMVPSLNFFESGITEQAAQKLFLALQEEIVIGRQQVLLPRQALLDNLSQRRTDSESQTPWNCVAYQTCRAHSLSLYRVNNNGGLEEMP